MFLHVEFSGLIRTEAFLAAGTHWSSSEAVMLAVNTEMLTPAEITASPRSSRRKAKPVWCADSCPSAFPGMTPHGCSGLVAGPSQLQGHFPVFHL